ncbi:FtsX-like permease family protein [Actinomadura sp. WMMA1423]|uniref:ABC transporter permease n=1 Tax=Actinomadura sp. WMMA1423 TaxID=2591108 RepID=UPI0011479232|nr:FtsX-like permease family protein [Actinomadura sp. WMMA1423]
MGRILLVFRLVAADVRRHPAQAAILLVSIVAATAALSLGRSLHGATETLYRQTRAATAGPDLVAYSPGADRTDIRALKSLERAPGVVAHSGPHREYYTKLTAHGSTGAAVVQVAGTAPGPVDRPLLTSGRWVRPGGAVFERGFAAALGVRVGDRVTVAGRTLPVVGVAVTAARSVYPWAPGIGPGGGPSDGGGLVWLAEPDTRALKSPDVPVTSFIGLRLRDPDAGLTWNSHDPAMAPFLAETGVTIRPWQAIAGQDSVILKGSQPILVIGGWLLGFLAIGGVATLAAGRAAAQTRRVGLLKAAGAAPGLIAAVLFAEYLTMALLADVLGLVAARLIEPSLINPSAGLITTAAGPTAGTVALTTVVALAVAGLTTLGPTVRAMRTETVAALADGAHRPRHRARLTRLSALLPTPLLLGLRLVARRPGRAVLHACNTATTLAMVTGLLVIFDQPAKGYPGSAMANHLRDAQEHHVILGVTATLIALAAINTVTTTWTTAQEARRTMAIARTLGATPGQITAGLSTAQLLPTLPGALAGLAMGLVLCLPFSAPNTSWPSAWVLFAAALAALPVTAALTAVPARIAARRSVAQTLSGEAP